ncbi:polyprenyl diphosphate synthase [Burkholderiales bacterium]|nr:polyprenyl diphosphate synthase [Burkholderiales bacterium]HAU82625.1 di-trans,poly-cis-decaprenylcistransferase [Betaproteobacteria bacterium]
MKTSTTQQIPKNVSFPRHVAIIMDGNGRWAKERYLPRVLGHRSGLKAVRKSVEFCHQNNIQFLTLFAFSSENWRRPIEEVSFLLALFQKSLEEEVAKLDKNNVRFKMIGDRSKFSTKLQDLIQEAERLTQDNTGLTLTVAANYGGRWDIVNAAKQAALSGHVELSEDVLSQYLQLQFAPEPDLLIRTGGEVRISNFVIWDLVYTELYFTDVLWPDFEIKHFYEALSHYSGRDRRFGRAGVDQEVLSENTVDHE